MRCFYVGGFGLDFVLDVDFGSWVDFLLEKEVCLGLGLDVCFVFGLGLGCCFVLGFVFEVVLEAGLVCGLMVGKIIAVGEGGNPYLHCINHAKSTPHPLPFIRPPVTPTCITKTTRLSSQSLPLI